MKRIIKVLIVAIVAVLVIVVLRRAVMRRRAELAQTPKWGTRPVPVHVSTVQQGPFAVRLSYVGVVEPVRVGDVSARLTAHVTDVQVDEGSVVRKGQTLIVLDSRDIHRAIDAIEHQIEQARADLAANDATVASLEKSVAYWRREARRDRELARKGSIPESQAEATEEKANEFEGRLAAARNKSAAIKKLIASLKSREEEQKVRLSYCALASPFDGVVSRRLVDPGDLAAPGKVLLTVEDRSVMRLAFDVPQDDLARVRPGLPVEFDVGGAVRRVSLTRLFPSLDSGRMVRAEIDLGPDKSAGLRSGAYVPLRVITARYDAVSLIPAAALARGPEDKPFVFAVHGEVLKAVPVTVLGVAGDQAAVKGVDPGEQVVTDTFLGWARLAASTKVTPIK